MAKPIVNKLGKRLEKFIKTHIVDVPPAKRKEFKEAAENLFLEAIEHGMEGTARGLKNG